MPKFLDVTDPAAAKNALGILPTFFVDAYGGDPTGATSSDSAITDILTAMGTNPGTIVFGEGTYKFSTTIAVGPYQSVVGASKSATILRYEGTGDCIRGTDPVSISGGEWERLYGSVGVLSDGTGPIWDTVGDVSGKGPRMSGNFQNFRIDGVNADDGASGLHLGDLTAPFVDNVVIVNFWRPGSKGAWFDSRKSWMERCNISIETVNCYQGTVFDGSNTINPVGSSVDYSSRINIAMFAGANQDGVVFKGKMEVAGVQLSITGNTEIAYGGSNAGTVLVVGESPSDEVVIAGCIIHLCVENGAPESSDPDLVAHTTIKIGNGSAIRQCQGSIMFIQKPPEFIQWQDGTGYDRLRGFSGVLNVDNTFGKMAINHGFRVKGLQTTNIGYIDETGSIYLTGNTFLKTLPSGNLTLSFNTQGEVTGNDLGFPNCVEFDIFLRQPASGAAGTVTWPAGFVWLAGSAPTLSTSSNAWDWIRVTTGDFETYFAEHVNAKLINPTISGDQTSLDAGVGQVHTIAAVSTQNDMAIRFAPKGLGSIQIYGATGKTPTIAAAGDDAAHDLNLTGKGAGSVLAGGVPVVTTTATQTISGKTLTSPIINTPTITGGGETLNAGAGQVHTFTAASSENDMAIRFAPKGSGAVQIYGTTGKTPTLAAAGDDAAHDLNLAAKGTGSVLVGGNPAGSKVSVPATSSTAGKPGYWAADSSYIYAYTGNGSTHSWVRASAATW